MVTNRTPPHPELTRKLERIRELLVRAELDAVWLRQTGNFAWATCGADAHINTADLTGIASLLITRTNQLVVTNNIEAERLRQEEGLAGPEWEFSVSPWYSAEHQIADLTRGLKLGADTSFPGAADLSSEVADLRSQLTHEEGQRFRELSAVCASGMQQAVEAVRPGLTEYEMDGLLAQAVESRGVQVIVNLIATDERISAFRHPLPTSKKLDRYAMLVVCGRKWGLICSMTRLIHFGPLPPDLRRRAEATARIDAEMIAATRPGATLGDVFRKAQAAYASAGFPEEWQLHHQGGSAGYAPREITATPASPQPIRVGQAFAWNPSITGVKSEDTVLVGEDTNEILTEIAGWPTLDVQIGDQIIKRPAILEKN